MLERVVISGFGGQGILFVAQLLGHAATAQGWEAAYLPSYGPEMRGGAANCVVTISDRKIMSPFASHPSSLIVMNLPSMDKFEPTLKAGGLLIVNISMVHRKPRRSDIRYLGVPATQIAEELGNRMLASVVALGCYIHATNVVVPDSVVAALPKMLKEDRADSIPANAEAFKTGLTWRAES